MLFVLFLYHIGSMTYFSTSFNNRKCQNITLSNNIFVSWANKSSNEQKCTEVSNVSQIWVTRISMQMCNYEWTFITCFCATFCRPTFQIGMDLVKNGSIAGKLYTSRGGGGVRGDRGEVWDKLFFEDIFEGHIFRTIYLGLMLFWCSTGYHANWPIWDHRNK